MIILDNENDVADSPTKTVYSVSRQGRDVEAGVTRPRNRGDDTYAVDQPPPPYSPTAAREDDPLLAPRKPVQKARYRFATAFAVAFVIFISSGICFNAIHRVHEEIPKRWPKPKTPPANPGFSEEVIQCIDMSEWTPKTSIPVSTGDIPKRTPLQIATANFDLPPSTDSLFFVSDGSVIGQVFVLTDETAPSEDVHVEILRKTKAAVLPQTHICVLKRGEGVFGVGILTPGHGSKSPDEQTSYVIYIKLPASRKHPRHYRALDIITSSMLVAFNDLSGSVKFDNVSIYSPVSSTIVESMHANRINITNTYGGIQGLFRASELLSLSTSNDPMFVNIDLHGGNPENPAELILINSNGTIQANVLLSPQVACDTSPDSGHTIPTSLPVEFPPPPHPTDLEDYPNPSTVLGLQASVTLPVPTVTPTPHISDTPCLPPTYSMHASAGSALTLNLHVTAASNETDALTPLLDVFADSKFASASLTLPATFEGNFDVRGRYTIVLDDVSTDPTGKGRKRTWKNDDGTARKGGSDGELSSQALEGDYQGNEGGGIERTKPGEVKKMSGKVWWGVEPGEYTLRSRVNVQAPKMAYLHFAE